MLLTGATGFVGKVVLAELLRRREELGVSRVLALVRASDAGQARARLRAEVVGSPCFAAAPAGWDAPLEPVAGDLVRPHLGLGGEALARLRSEATHVIHCAASVEFALPLAEATAVNTTGALHALELARTCARLESFVGVSTAYVAPHAASASGICTADEVLAPLARDPEALYAAILAGSVDADRLLEETGHPNTYTLTKCLAEHLVSRRLDDVPVTLVRPSIVSASRSQPRPGWIDSPAAFASFVTAIGTGRLRVVAGDPGTKLDVVPCDEVAHRIVEAAFSPAPRGALSIRHAVAGLAGSCPVELCRDRIVGYFRAHPGAWDPRLAFVGPHGPRFHLEHALRHEMPGIGASLWLGLRRDRGRALAARRLLARQRAINREFAYFTHKTFDFRTSVPLEPGLEPASYLDTVCEGVQRHLLRRERRTRRGAAARAAEGVHQASAAE